VRRQPGGWEESVGGEPTSAPGTAGFDLTERTGRTPARSRLTRRTLLKAAVGGGALAVLGACTQGDSSPPPAGTAGEAAPSGAARSIPGGQLIISAGTEPENLNEVVGGASQVRFVGQFLFDGLVRPGRDLRMEPALAESWTSPDGRSYTFKLRPGVKFHDGQEFTATDVKFTWELYLNPLLPRVSDSVNYLYNIQGARAFKDGSAETVSGIRTPDPYTVEVECEAPYAPFVPLVAAMFILPKHVYGAFPPEEIEKHPSFRHPVGTGPFKLAEWKASEYLSLQANLEYWAGRPKLDRIIMKVAPDPTTFPSLLRSGAVDAVGIGTVLSVPDAEPFERDAAFKVYELGGIFNHYVEFNFRNPLLQDVLVRRALVHAFDRESVVKNLYRGKAKMVNTSVPPTSWAYTPPKTQYEYNPEKARALLREAGWSPGPDGVLAKNGQRLSLEIATFDRLIQDYPVIMLQQWKEIGVDATLTPMAMAALIGQRLRTGQYDVIAYSNTTGSYYDPSRLIDIIASSTTSRNKYGNPRVDRLLAEARTTIDEAERKAKYAEIFEVVAQDVPHFWVAAPRDLWVTTSKVRLADYPLSVLQYDRAREWERVG
jgi:peptide/nickel transport system substrate-binding protein